MKYQCWSLPATPGTLTTPPVKHPPTSGSSCCASEDTLQQNPTSLRELTHLGLDTWNDPATGHLRLHQLAALVKDGSLRDSDVDAVKKAIRQAWHD